jgi:hypothetical protein
VEVDPEKFSAVREVSPPTNAKELKRFLGNVEFNRKFIENFSRIAKPLYNLTMKKNPKSFNWGDHEHQSFSALIKKVCSAPILLSQTSLYSLFCTWMRVPLV